MGAKTPTSKIEANAIALVALESYCGREADKTALAEGSAFEGIRLDVTGKVGRRKVQFELAGRLTVGHGSPTGSTKSPSAKSLLAYCLSSFDMKQLAAITKHAENGSLPEPSEVGNLAMANRGLHFPKRARRLSLSRGVFRSDLAERTSLFRCSFLSQKILSFG